MSQYASPQHPASRPAPSSGGGVDIQTLFITAVASAAAAFACSKIWAPGTLAAAAFTPVLVAVIKEALAKSTAVVAKAVPPVRGVVRSARVGDTGVAGEPSASADALPPVGSLSGDAPAESAPWVAPSAVDPADPATWIASQQPGGFAVDAPDDVAARVAQPGEVSYHDTPSNRRGWKLAIITGLLGFLIGAVIITVPELMAGSSASGGGRETTLFGGSTHKHVVTTTVTTETETQTVPTQTVTIPPAKTVTVPAPTTTVPAPTTAEPPAAAPDATTDPAQTTTVPEVTEPSVPQPPG
jgi:hypothetical protein